MTFREMILRDRHRYLLDYVRLCLCGFQKVRELFFLSATCLNQIQSQEGAESLTFTAGVEPETS